MICSYDKETSRVVLRLSYRVVRYMKKKMLAIKLRVINNIKLYFYNADNLSGLYTMYTDIFGRNLNIIIPKIYSIWQIQMPPNDFFILAKSYFTIRVENQIEKHCY